MIANDESIIPAKSSGGRSLERSKSTQSKERVGLQLLLGTLELLSTDWVEENRLHLEHTSIRPIRLESHCTNNVRPELHLDVDYSKFIYSENCLSCQLCIL